MQIKASQVVNSKELSRCASRQQQGCKSDFAALPAGSLCCSTTHNTHPALANSPCLQGEGPDSRSNVAV